MSELKSWLESQERQEKTVELRGKKFVVREFDLLTRSRTVSLGKSDNEIECRLLAACVTDPETGEPVEQDWTWWQGRGQQIASPLLTACLEVNGMVRDEVADEVKD